VIECEKIEEAEKTWLQARNWSCFCWETWA